MGVPIEEKKKIIMKFWTNHNMPQRNNVDKSRMHNA